MQRPEVDVVGIGNAIVDVLALTTDDFLAANGLSKGAMTLVDAERAEALYAVMGPAVECSGGSAANTVVGLASFGTRSAFIGKVADDQLGRIFRHDIEAAGVAFDTPPSSSGLPTSRCLVLVTQDGQRTMQTHLGACADLAPADIEERTIANARLIYLEAYLWDKPAAKDAFRKAIWLAKSHGRKVAMTLSDPVCVERHRSEFHHLLHQVDILFANEAEITSLYRANDFDGALAGLRTHMRTGIAALTRSEKGSVVYQNGQVTAVPAQLVDSVVDTTGAGDLYAAGFLYGLSLGHDVRQCARLGSIAAAEIISHIGARPMISLKNLVSVTTA